MRRDENDRSERSETNGRFDDNGRKLVGFDDRSVVVDMAERENPIKQYKVWKRGGIVETSQPGLYAGIKTTKIFGRLTCGSGKRAKKER